MGVALGRDEGSDRALLARVHVGLAEVAAVCHDVRHLAQLPRLAGTEPELREHVRVRRREHHHHRRRAAGHRHGGCPWKRHIGLYAYRAGALRAFAACLRCRDGPCKGEQDSGTCCAKQTAVPSKPGKFLLLFRPPRGQQSRREDIEEDNRPLGKQAESRCRSIQHPTAQIITLVSLPETYPGNQGKTADKHVEHGQGGVQGPKACSQHEVGNIFMQFRLIWPKHLGKANSQEDGEEAEERRSQSG